MHKYNQINIDSQKKSWLISRKKGISGTDVSAILGYNPYRTAFDIYEDKISQELNLIEENEKMIWGNLLEDSIAKEFAMRTKLKIRKFPKYRILKHFKYPYLIGTPDRIIIDNGIKGILEIKTVDSNIYSHWDSIVPLSYYSQLQHYLGLSPKYEFGFFAILIGGNRLEIIKIEKDKEFIKEQENQLKIFWSENVIKKDPPKLVSKDYDKMTSSCSAVEANSETIFWFNELKEIKKQLSELEIKKLELTANIKEFIKDNEILTLNNHPIVSYKSYESKRLNSQLIKQDYPDVYKKYYIVSTYRKFEIKEINHNAR